MIKGSIGRDSDAKEEDVLVTKKALKKLGYYKTPSYGLTAYPDNELFSAISAFQKDQGIAPNGKMKKGDKTSQLLSTFVDTYDEEDIEGETPDNSPIFRCTQCGAPHGGSMGDLCPSCTAKA